VGDPGGGMKRRATAMQARPAKHKLVKLANACLLRPRAEQPSGRGDDSTLAIKVAVQIGGYACLPRHR
jgi:hypothetical protein